MKAELELISLQNDKSILAFHYDKKDFDTPWHFHPQFELTYIKGSNGTKFIGDFVGPYQPGELVLLSGNLPHCWKNYAEQTESAQSIVVQWNPSIFAKIPELKPLFSMLRTAERGIIFDQKAVDPIVAQISDLPQSHGQQLYIKLLSLLTALAESPFQTLSESRFSEKLALEYSSRIAKIHDFVGIAFHRKIYLKELAELVNMSEQSFSRFFSKMMGRPFFTFLNEYRINVAGRMLIDTDWSVAQIGFACGYESLPFFHKQFNKFKAETPSRYRRKYSQ